MINQLIIVMLHAQIQIFFRKGWGGGGWFDGYLNYVCRVLGGLGVGSDAYFRLFYNAMLRNVNIYVSLVWIPPPTAFL